MESETCNCFSVQPVVRLSRTVVSVLRCPNRTPLPHISAIKTASFSASHQTIQNPPGPATRGRNSPRSRRRRSSLATSTGRRGAARGRARCGPPGGHRAARPSDTAGSLCRRTASRPLAGWGAVEGWEGLLWEYTSEMRYGVIYRRRLCRLYYGTIIA